jgi:hypothetical protein
MRKVTSRLLAAGFAAIVMSACQDSVAIVQPPPPPPPPPPPTVDATVTIQGMRTIPGNAPVNPTVVFGDINVVLNVDEGTQTVTDVSLTLDGAPLACQGISTAVSPGAGVSTAAAADEIECFFNTDDTVGSCVGDQLDARYGNGDHVLGARVTLSDGTTRDASNAQQITLVNSSFIMIGWVDEGNTTIGSNGRLYHGGADLQFGACPVSYNGTVVGTLSMEADDNGGAATSCDQDQGGAAFGGCGDGDLGSGAGAPHTDSASPFVFTMSKKNNDSFDSGSGDAGTGVEDTGAGVGHEVFTVGSVFDADGLNVTSEFGGGYLGGFWVDLVPPRVNCSAGCAGFAASEIVVNEPAAGSSTMMTWYSDADFSLSNVREEGSGYAFGSGASMDIGDCSDTDNSDGLDSTPFVPLFSDVSGTDDLDEDDWSAGDDAFGGTDAGNDCYLGELRTLMDEVGNAANLADPAAIPMQIQTLTSLGVDRTAADISAQQPAATITVLNPDANANGMVCADAGDCTLMLSALDPDLGSGDPGSQVDETGCAGVCGSIIATIDDGPGTTNDDEDLDVNDNGTAAPVPATTAQDYVVLLTSGTGTFPLADGAYTITVDVDDNALDPNTGSHTYSFILDDTAPVFGALNPAPVGSAGTDASAIVMTIGGTINDANIIKDAELEVYVDGTDNIGTGFDGVCDSATDFKLSVSGGDIDRNDIDHENGTNTIAFNESFTINQPDAVARSLNYCFIHKAQDEAVLKTGTATGNSSSLSTLVVVVWNVG